MLKNIDLVKSKNFAKFKNFKNFTTRYKKLFKKLIKFKISEKSSY